MRSEANCMPIIIATTVVAGAGDLITGLFLVFAPEWALALMKVPTVHEPVFVGFIGCFVGAVGCSYYWGLAAWYWTGSMQRLRTVWEITMIFRVLAGGFVLFHVVAGTLVPAWLTVPITDWVWVIVQAILIHAGVFRISER